MSNNFLTTAEKLFEQKLQSSFPGKKPDLKQPVHVVYGGADRFTAETPTKLGKLALDSLEKYAPNFVEFANAFWLKGCDTLPMYEDVIESLEKSLKENPQKMKNENFAAWFAWKIYNQTVGKLINQPIEDFRIDFEDGYGIRSNEEEDSHAISSSNELAKAFNNQTITAFCGFRIKSFQPETYSRAIQTLDLFLKNLLKNTNGLLPENFVVTLPKIVRIEEIEVLDNLLTLFENEKGLQPNSIKIEVMIETAESILILPQIAKSSPKRVVSAHFGAYDYTSGFGITALHQYLKHPACDFARNMMQIAFSPLGIRLSDSVTTEMPVPVHKGETLSPEQIKENKMTVHKAWRLHFNNVNHSLISGFYQSWDLHPAQLAARYAAVFSFYLDSFDSQADRLKRFIEQATKATLSGSQFDDTASANGLLNYFNRYISSGVVSESEIWEATGLTAGEIKSGSFLQIINRKF